MTFRAIGVIYKPSPKVSKSTRHPISAVRAEAKHDALRAGFTRDEILNLSEMDRWFLVQIKKLVAFEEELATAKNTN